MPTMQAPDNEFKTEKKIPEEVKEYVNNTVTDAILSYHKKNMEMLTALGDVIDDLSNFADELMVDQLTTNSLVFNTEEKMQAFEQAKKMLKKKIEEVKEKE